MLKDCDHNRELILMGDLNLDWDDKIKINKLKAIMDKNNLERLIKGSTRITKSSRTKLDLIFSNRPENDQIV